MTLVQTENAYNLALGAIAQGATYGETLRAVCGENMPIEGYGEVYAILGEAFDGAMSCGIEREDVDPSWLN